MFREIFFGNRKNFCREVVFLHAALILTSIAFVCIFSYSTSPFYDLLGGDSSIFQVVGKYWALGYLPYVDLFENKGPLLFLINAIGYAIYPRAGIIIPQIFCLYVSILFVWRAISLYSSSKWRIFFVLLTLIYYAAHYEEGNHVSEYTLPFLTASTYFFLQNLKSNEFSPLVGFVHGVGFGACAMIRLSEAAQICCQAILIAIFLIRDKKFKILRQNVVNFIAGAAIMILPFVIYFAANNALYEMLYGTFLFNFKYALENTLPTPPLFRIYYSAFHFLPFYAMIFVALLAKSNFRLRFSAIFIGAMFILLFLKLHPADQYLMIFLPSAPILFAILYESRDSLQKIWSVAGFSPKKLLIQFLLIISVFHIYITAFFLKAELFNEETATYMFFTSYKKLAEVENSAERENILKLKALIPENERNSFVCWGNTLTGSHWILRSGIKPRNRFFTSIGWISEADPSLRDEWFADFRRDPPLWVLYGGSNNIELENLLAKQYFLAGEVYIYPQNMRLYRLKE